MDVQPWFTGTFEINLPSRSSSQGLLLISNHRSTLDAFILLSRVEGIRIFTKKSLLLIPGIGFMMRMTRQIPARRGQIDSFFEAMDIVRQRLRNGEIVHIFGEMTRCEEGFPGVQRFSSYPFLLAIQENVSIVPIVFFETDHVWPKGSSALRFRHPIKVKSLATINSGQFSSAEILKEEVRRVIETSFRGSPDDHSPVPVHSHLQQQSDH
jgi:1-acyl-sn-glycerol-3-phosphate acyltransferase